MLALAYIIDGLRHQIIAVGGHRFFRQQLLPGRRGGIGGVRLLPGRFMVIQQAMAMRRGGSEAAARFLDAFIESQKRSGFVANALTRHGIEGATVAA